MVPVSCPVPSSEPSSGSRFDCGHEFNLIENRGKWHPTFIKAALLLLADRCREVVAFLLAACPLTATGDGGHFEEGKTCEMKMAVTNWGFYLYSF